MRRPTPTRAAGFTLVELLVSLAIAAIVITGVFNLYTTFFRSTNAQDEVLSLQQNARVGLDDLERDLRLAGVDITRGDAAVPDQAVFAFAGPYEVVFNANLDDNTAGIRPDKAPDKVPSNLAVGAIPDYDPSQTYPYAETVRWSLDANDDGTLDGADRMASENPALYRLVRQIYGYSAGTDSNGPETASGAEDVRGPEVYPDGTRPPVLFQYWVKEVDLDDDKTVDPGEDINGNGVIDTFLWGDDGGTAGTGSVFAGNGVLDDSEIDALLTGNAGGPKVIDNFNALVTATTGDARATVLTRAQVLSNIQRVVVNVVTEAPTGDPNYKASPHGAAYPYREHRVTASVAPRNKLTNVTSDTSLTIAASPTDVQCPATSTVLTVSLRDASGALFTVAADVDVTTSLGSFSPSASQPSTTLTLSGGTASTVLYGDPSTTSTMAVVNGQTTVGSETYHASTTVNFVPGAADSIQVTPAVPALPADGLTATTVTANLLDACGKPAGDGDTVNWAVATNPAGIGGSVAPASGIVAGNLIETTLTSGLSSGIATITATDTASAVSGAGTVNFTDCVVTVTPDSSALPADGFSTTGVTIHLADVGGTPQAGVTLDVTTSDGTLLPASVVTDAAGNAVAVLTSSSTPHNALIRASVPAAGGYCAYAVGEATVELSDCGIVVTSDVVEVVPGSPGGQAVVTATVTESTGGTPLPGQTVSFNLVAADGSLSPLSDVTDSSGVATTTFTGGPTTGVATITGSTGCGVSSINVYVRDCVVSAIASPASMTTSGGTTTVTATLTDSVSGTPLAGRTVSFSLDNPSLADFTSATTAVTDSNGEASVTLGSNGLAGTVSVTATSDCGSASVDVVVADWQISLVTSNSTVSQGATATLTATIKSGGVPTDPAAPDDMVTITFDAPGGLGSTVIPASMATSSGTSTHTFTAGSTAGTVTVRATATIGGLAISATVDIVITSAGGLNDLVLDPMSPSICGNSHDKTGFRVRNAGLDDLTITAMQVTWTGGGQIERVKSGGTPVGCSGGSDLWVQNGCGKPDGRQDSPASLTVFCKNVVINQGAYYSFNELNFRNVDLRGETVTVVLTHQPSGGGSSQTSTITFTVPNF